MLTRRTFFLALVAVIVLVGAALVVSRRGASGVPVDVRSPTRHATFRSTVTASGEIVATRYADIGSSVMGKIVSLPVRESDRVTAGQVLARIDAVQAQSSLASAEAQVRALESDERAVREQVKAAQADLAAAEAHARDATQQFARSRDLFARGLVPESEFQTARAAADTAGAQVSSARAAVDRTTESQVAASRRVAQARAQRAGADDVVSKTSIVSPIDGVVSRLRVREGEMVVVGIQNQPGTTLMTISDLRQIDAEVKVAEADVLRVEVGQAATVVLEALPGRTFRGKVVEVGASALPVSGTGAAAREFKVVVRLDDTEPGLRPGLTCDADIVTSERANVLTVPLQGVVLRPGPEGVDHTGVFVIKDGTAAFLPVKAGVIGGLDMEVSGLAEGESVVVGPYQTLRDLQDGAPVTVNARKR
jgi:HlyD family secretion protein